MSSRRNKQPKTTCNPNDLRSAGIFGILRTDERPVGILFEERRHIRPGGMPRMSEEIFRKKSLDKIKSPENMNDYVRVSNPGIWLLLISVIALLTGACVWGVCGHVDRTLPIAVQVENGEIVCYAESTDIEDLKPGLAVKIDDIDGVVTEIGERNANGYEIVVQMNSVPADGFYSGKVVVENISPISFILN